MVVLFVLELFILVLTATLICAILKVISGRVCVEPSQRPRGAVQPEPAYHPETLEGVLVSQRVAGEITRRQYRTAMAGVAARDADRHPLEVPPEASPPEPA
jgi:hypothetical protein